MRATPRRSTRSTRARDVTTRPPADPPAPASAAPRARAPRRRVRPRGRRARARAAARPAARPARRLGVCSALLILGFGALGGACRPAAARERRPSTRSSRSKLALHTIPLTAQRGSVFDRNGRDLAMSIEQTTVYADPTLVTDPVARGRASSRRSSTSTEHDAAASACPTRAPRARPVASSTSRTRFADDVARGRAGPEAPGHRLRARVGAQLSRRSRSPASVIGAGRAPTAPALAGIEKQYDSLLAGKSGELVVEQDPLGHDIPEHATRPRSTRSAAPTSC